MRVKGRFDVEFDSEKDAASAETALSHEGKGSGRGRVSILRKRKTLEVSIDASDTVAFRAMINTIMRDLQVVEGEIIVCKEETKNNL
ncbi:MAG: KEOPS complex subunit Pcc1 [Candidatus Bilamarchaeaceae archaeon]